LNTAKGGTPQGAPARRLSPARLIGAGPSPTPAAPRRPSGCRMPLRRFAPPCATAPKGSGASVDPAPAPAVQVLARFRSSKVFASPWPAEARGRRRLTYQRDSPLRHHPLGGGARPFWIGAPASRVRAPSKHGRVFPRTLPGSARQSRRPARSLIITANGGPQ